MRAVYYKKSFEGNSRKFSKFENEGNIFECFGIPSFNGISFDANFLTNFKIFVISDSNVT